MAATRRHVPMLAALLALTSGVGGLTAQAPAGSDGALSAFSFRSVGPAFTSGRIADVAVDPSNKHVWYVASASGHLWKTTNRGLTFDPVFDEYGS